MRNPDLVETYNFVRPRSIHASLEGEVAGATDNLKLVASVAALAVTDVLNTARLTFSPRLMNEGKYNGILESEELKAIYEAVGWSPDQAKPRQLRASLATLWAVRGASSLFKFSGVEDYAMVAVNNPYNGSRVELINRAPERTDLQVVTRDLEDSEVYYQVSATQPTAPLSMVRGYGAGLSVESWRMGRFMHSIPVDAGSLALAGTDLAYRVKTNG